MLCSPNEGAAAVVLSARPGPVGPPVRGARRGAALAPAGQRARRAHADVAAWSATSRRARPRLAARAAYEAAGVAPADLDVVELQDTDSGREILSVEELGLCPRGGGGRFVADGTGEMTGTLPVNPSGGLLSKGEPLGASALGQIVELTWQLRGAAGARQVDGRALRARRTPSDAAPTRRS